MSGVVAVGRGQLFTAGERDGVQELHELWAADQPPTPEAERELMTRYGMEPA